MNNSLLRQLRLLLVWVVIVLGCISVTWNSHAEINLDLLLQQIQQKFGNTGAERVRAWRKMLNETPVQLPDQQKMERINQFFNRNITFSEDTIIWGQADYWATPGETLGRGMGDCEDYAFAKYFSLVEAGIAPAKLRITYVRARIGGTGSTIFQAHMILAYYPTPDAEPLILDNLISDIRPASRRTDLTPVFSFNSDGIWTTGNQPSHNPDRLARWVDLLKRMRQEGSMP